MRTLNIHAAIIILFSVLYVPTSQVNADASMNVLVSEKALTKNLETVKMATDAHIRGEISDADYANKFVGGTIKILEGMTEIPTSCVRARDELKTLFQTIQVLISVSSSASTEVKPLLSDMKTVRCG